MALKLQKVSPGKHRIVLGDGRPLTGPMPTLQAQKKLVGLRRESLRQKRQPGPLVRESSAEPPSSELIDWHRTSPEPPVESELRAHEADDASADNLSTHFGGKFPGEIRDWLKEHPEARFQFKQNAPHGKAEDVLGTLGADEYLRRIDPAWATRPMPRRKLQRGMARWTRGRLSSRTSTKRCRRVVASAPRIT